MRCAVVLLSNVYVSQSVVCWCHRLEIWCNIRGWEGKLTLDDFLGTGSESRSPSQIWAETRKFKLREGGSMCLGLSRPLGSCQDGG